MGKTRLEAQAIYKKSNRFNVITYLQEHLQWLFLKN